MFFSSVAFAAEAPKAAPSFIEQMVPFVFIFLIFYFLIIRPQQQRAKKHGGFLQALKRGDSVLTAGGLLGTIEGITERYVTLEVADGVRVRYLKSQISGLADVEKK